jgi:hypothetical protein
MPTPAWDRGSALLHPTVPAFGFLARHAVFLILPAVIIGGIALVFFSDLLGGQADAIAMLVALVSSQCIPGTQVEGAAAVLDCNRYLLQVGFFFLLLALWLIVAFGITLRLWESLPYPVARRAFATIVAVSLPFVLVLKYVIFLFDNEYMSMLYGGAQSVFSLRMVLPTLVLVEVLAVTGFCLYRGNSLPGSWARLEVAFPMTIGVFILASFAIAFYPSTLAQRIGSLNLIVSFTLLAYVFWGSLLYYGQSLRAPIVTLLLIYVFLIDILGFTAGGDILRSAGKERPKGDAGPGLTFRDQFSEWLQHRADRSAYQNKGQVYPVYIVAASGGGMTAAIRTAYVLDFLQRRCPAFLRHTFAISGVSGGALGALAFVAHRQTPEGMNRSRPEQDARGCDLELNARTGSIVGLDRFFDGDLLATIVGAGLFPNMLQRVWPWHIHIFDRSYSFGKALESNWQIAVRASIVARKKDEIAVRPPTDTTSAPALKGNPCANAEDFLKCPMNEYWTTSRENPALVFTTTLAGSGEPLILSNLDFGSASSLYSISPATAHWLSGRHLRAKREEDRILIERKSIPLIQGVSLSGRFPISLPGGIIEGMRIVDGGYFDNSGLAAATVMKLDIEKANPDVKVRILYLGEVPNDYEGETTGLLGGVELIHANALYKVRESHSKLLVRSFGESIRDAVACKREETCYLAFTWRASSHTGVSAVPLAWYVPPPMRQYIKENVEVVALKYLDVLDKDLSLQ